MSFNEAALEQAIIDLLGEQGYPHSNGATFVRDKREVLLKDDLRTYLQQRYAVDNITAGEIDAIIRKLEAYSSADLYDSNRAIHKLVSDGFLLKRESVASNKHKSQKDLYIQLIDYTGLPESRMPDPESLDLVVAHGGTEYSTARAELNIYRVVNQLEIEGFERRIPDAILYINGLPLVVFEFKSAVREEATIYQAYEQLTVRYKRDIPELLKYNSLCVISDGVNSRVGSLFAPYDFYYTWRKVTGDETIEQDGINALYTMLNGLFDKNRLREVLRHFIYFPDSSKRDEKIVCRYPQFYAATKLYDNILTHRKPAGDGKGGTYFGATGCGKSYTMLFLSRLLMKSLAFESPTIVLITDRTDLDDQLSKQFTSAKTYVGDQTIVSVESRAQLRELLKGRNSGGVFLATIHKFTEDAELLTDRSNVICISDEAHRSQVNLDQNVRITEKGVRRTFGFAKYLHDSLPNATYVGFTGTPIDATLDVFGEVIDSYTMTESVKDEITVRIVYEGRAAKVILDNKKLEEIEQYYAECADDGTSDYQIEESKKSSANMSAILGDPDRIRALAADFVQHYETRVSEGSTVKGKAIFVCSKRDIAYDFWQEVIALKPEWNEVLSCEAGATLTDQEMKEIKPIERVKMIMTRGKDDPEKLYNLLGNAEYRKELDRQFKNPKSNFKIAIVVDMWLTGFDVPFLDTIYIDKPIQRHNLIQTISRVNRKYEGKDKGLVVDYIGIKKQMNLALAHYNKADQQNIEEIDKSIVAVKDHLDLLNKLFHKFDASKYYKGSPVEQLHCLNMAAEFAQITDKIEKRFMALVKRLKAAYDICSGSERISQAERDQIHFYLAVRSIVFKLTKGDAPDVAQMNARVREMIKDALHADGVEEIFKMGEDSDGVADLFDPDYLAKIDKIKLPNTKIKLLQQLLAKAIEDFKKVNKVQAQDFSKRFKTLVDNYNERKEDDVLVSGVLEDFSDEIMDMIHALKDEYDSFEDLGIDLEDKAFYDILKRLAEKYDFTYPDDKLITLAQAVKDVVKDKVKYTDWSQREDIKAELKVGLILVLAKFGYPPVDRDEVYKEIFEQAENFKRFQNT
ncbi:Type-1 restriction enzyme R protein [Zhongshania aliphaticivorans]|uniref:Type I restriction enzyme endonuclease subunit n=1 Tax=Zhongshania aliphaticivorans TaxID=1470434 RepID=A0A5S9NVE7_9GAMM|nr:HsdR family type I site-specific deoxyribonuclease [Zhongshania aliphaticivorans]CAA0088564.1 Type-1 restriction enzyme R protein [Zhongshania aliphaticivorans]CAA0094642.1 Type-1 restriction enzyme R protein [Zhongshania aliphaticivorans]